MKPCQHHAPCHSFDVAVYAAMPADGRLHLNWAAEAPVPFAMSPKIWWKQPLTYLLLPTVTILVLVGVLPPFPPSRPTKPSQEQSEPAKEKSTE